MGYNICRIVLPDVGLTIWMIPIDNYQWTLLNVSIKNYGKILPVKIGNQREHVHLQRRTNASVDNNYPNNLITSSSN